MKPPITAFDGTVWHWYGRYGYDEEGTDPETSLRTVAPDGTIWVFKNGKRTLYTDGW